MKKIDIFDPAMCCSTGVCGPSVDKDLMRVAIVVSSLKEQGIDISRHNLSSEPQDFVSNKIISEILQTEGADVLPVTLADGEIVKTREYPTNGELSKWLGVAVDTTKPAPTCCQDSDNSGCC